MKYQSILIGLGMLPFINSCQGQTGQATAGATGETTNRVGGDCEEGYCELMYVGIPQEINPVDTSKGWFEKGQKLIVTGTVYKIDGKTPAPGVIVYYHHTDHEGYYSPGPNKPEDQTRHGHLRGWVKTDASGKYTLFTNRPAPYPNENLPAHIHLIIKEPNIKNEYWIDDLVFDDDKLLIPYRKKYPETAPRGGSGTLRVLLKNGIQIAEHDIILGLNIPNYPFKAADEEQSGLHIGEDQPSFGPFHAFGPDKGSQACPVCKYGRYHGILYFVGNHPNWKEIESWLIFLEQQSIRRQDKLKVYFVYGNENQYNKKERQKQLEQLGKRLNIQKIALTFVPSFIDGETEVNLNKINPKVENTFIIYRYRRIIDKYIGLKPTPENFAMVSNILQNSQGGYFDLPMPPHD